MIQDDVFRTLESGPVYAFRDWRNSVVPPVVIGVYTIWDADQLLYVGMAGEKLTADKISEFRKENKKKGLFERLHNHASGRRSGDAFCIYISHLSTILRPSLRIIAVAGILSVVLVDGEDNWISSRPLRTALMTCPCLSIGSSGCT
jgi:hypothetical protein